MNIKRYELSVEEQGKADSYIADLAMARSKRPHDAAWREAEQITGLGDYIPADEGMHWSDNNERTFKNQERDEDVRANEVEIAQELAKTGIY